MVGVKNSRLALNSRALSTILSLNFLKLDIHGSSNSLLASKSLDVYSDALSLNHQQLLRKVKILNSRRFFFSICTIFNC